MRARRREINIFNMSLLDILCGALGAFCFMMIVALPYYKPPGSNANLRKNQEETAELLKEVEELKERLSDPAQAEELEALLRKLEARIKELQGQVNMYASENEELKDENEKLTKEKNEAERKLNLRKPFLILVGADTSQDMDMYVQDDVHLPGSAGNPPFDPARDRHNVYWKGDLLAYVTHHGVVAWVTTDVPIGTHFKIYLKLANEPAARKSTRVFSGVFGDGFNFALPDVTLTPERFWTLVGTITVDPSGKLNFVEATAEEREAEWKALTKSTPTPAPTATPASTATPAPAPTALAIPTPAPSVPMSKERMALMEKLQRLRQLQMSPDAAAHSDEIGKLMQEVAADRERIEQQERAQRQKAPPSPSGSTNSMDERRALVEKLRKEQEQRSPGPASTAPASPGRQTAPPLSPAPSPAR